MRPKAAEWLSSAGTRHASYSPDNPPSERLSRSPVIPTPSSRCWLKKSRTPTTAGPTTIRFICPTPPWRATFRLRQPKAKSSTRVISPTSCSKSPILRVTMKPSCRSVVCWDACITSKKPTKTRSSSGTPCSSPKSWRASLPSSPSFLDAWRSPRSVLEASAS